jgi:hypothetical protein
MTTAAEGPSTVVTAWQLESARLVAFPAEPALFLEQHWWQDLTSGQPEDHVSARKKNLREERGSFQGVSLSLRIDPTRVEWSIQPPGEFEDPLESYPTIGSFREKVNWFVGLLGSWLADSCPPLLRLAFAGKLLQSTGTQQEAYRILGAYLPAANLNPNPNDFLFQVNRRRMSTVVPGLPINRVTSWSKLNVALSMPPRAPFSWPENCYSAVELDMNTAPERSEVLPRELLPQLFEELVSLGVEIAERGDIP